MGFISPEYTLQLSPKYKQKNFFPYINIKYCVWYFKRSLKIQKNRFYSNEIDNNNNLYTYYKAISNFPLLPYFYSKIKNIYKKNEYNNFLEFLEYFKVNYLNKYNENNWNYYNNREHITNCALEFYNN